MNKQLKFQYIKSHWELRNGIVYSKRTGKPVSFSGKNQKGKAHRFAMVKINGEHYYILIYEAIFMLHHDRAIAEGKELHHVDGNCENNVIDNLIELTRKQHRRIHKYQLDAPLRGIYFEEGAWRFRWNDDNNKRRSRTFQSINEAMKFRAEIERPRRQELRALGLNCKRAGNRQTASTLRQRNRQQNPRLWRHRQ
ncbi:HNH endonuclease [Escherichia coli]|uniref:HNH endonuclease n=1 Tax=Escherichia coli TaxID=562 RepID=UPI001759BEA0|nr:HNH endonuclease [Escherichia coli]EFH4467589.1 HNH endonuclease [Escherichia coli]EII8416092.1 HNH endonuclease [Escherichia coli]EKP6484553.1 HNH endonuclease [Escherichia coli]EKP6503796.1 HNH endonuclease [Escherichia coli]EKQ3776901.1 HNH endonuclease [Escherichia coli]